MRNQVEAMRTRTSPFGCRRCSVHDQQNGSDTDAHTDHAAPAATMQLSPRRMIRDSLLTPPVHLPDWVPLRDTESMPVVHTGGGDSVRAWVVYPERSSKAPVVVVVHEIFGLSSWVRGVADQLAAMVYCHRARLLTMKNLPMAPTASWRASHPR